MTRFRSTIMGMALAAVAVAPLAAVADYPTKPVRVIVTFPPGGSADTAMRLLTPKLAEELGQQFIIENRPGAGGHIGMTALANSAPDGYTIGVGAAGAMATNHIFYPDQKDFNPLEKLTPITLLAHIPFVWLARADLPANSAADFIEWARTNPASGAHGGTGSAMHLSIELLNHLGNTDITTIAYKGSGPAATDTAGGQVDVSVVDIPSALPHVEAKRAKILAVTGGERFGNLPDVPTIMEAGVADYAATGWFGLVAPANTPQDIVDKLYRAFDVALNDPEIVERSMAMGMVLQSMPPAEYAQFIRDETEKWSELIEAAGIAPN